MTDIFCMKILREKLPRVYELEPGRYQVDLRGKRLEPIRLAVSNGKKRLNFSSKADALAKAAELETHLLTHGAERLNDISQFVSNGELTRLAAALAIHGKTLSEAAEFYLGHIESIAAIGRSRPISELLDEWLEARTNNRNKPLRQRTLDNLRSRARGIKSYFGEKRLLEIASEDVERWTNNMQSSSQTRDHYRNIFGQFFNWCRKRKLCEINPCSSVEIHVENERPEYMKPADVVTTLNFIRQSKVYRNFMPMHLVGFFSGVRTEEMTRLTWNDFNFDQGSLFISKDASKVKADRLVQLETNLVESLKKWRAEYPSDPFCPKRHIVDGLKRLRKNLEKFGIKWHNNSMRHSYASYFLAKYESFDRLEKNLGNSKAVLQKHYLRTPSKQEAEEYFKIEI